LAWASFVQAEQDTTLYNRATRGRPFALKEFLNPKSMDPVPSTGVPEWVTSGTITVDTVYYGIGQSAISAAAADDAARLHFAQFVEVNVQSIAARQIAENKDRLAEDYNYQSWVKTNTDLHSIKLTERYVTEDSTYFSLIRYGKAAYHDLVTQEIKVSLEADIRQQELAHQAQEALQADSLRHKLTMDSLALSRRQAVVDSLDRMLQMAAARQEQAEAQLRLLQRKYRSFLEITPWYQLIDVPSATLPNSRVYASGRWNPESGDIRQLKLGLSAWLLSAEANLWAQASQLDQGDISLKLQLLPERGALYRISLALGWTAYMASYSGAESVDLRDFATYSQLGSQIRNQINENTLGASLFITGTVGLPQLDQQLSLYLDSRELAMASIWYPFPDNLGDALSLINQVALIKAPAYRDRFNDNLQWQLGLRLIAIPDRFATMISYEDHEVWLLNFEFQY